MPDIDEIMNPEPRPTRNEEEIIIDENFSYEGYQVVRGEFFAHLREPGITFSNGKVNLNAACLKRLPEVDYVQFLVNPTTQILAVRPCTEEAKDSFLWCHTRVDGKRVPRVITCRMFFARLSELMGWNPEYRYNIMGKIMNSGDDYLILFDLKSTEVFQRLTLTDGRERTSRTPGFPAEWRNQFGLPVEEHKKLLQVNIFDGYTVFGIKDKKPSQQNFEGGNTNE